MLAQIHQEELLALEAVAAAVVLKNKAIHGLAPLPLEVVMVEQEKQIIIDMDMMLLTCRRWWCISQPSPGGFGGLVEEEREEYRLLELCTMD